jgi:DNA (cytosine-5)-methyltransferase 1
LTEGVNPPILPNHETATTDKAIWLPICCCQGFRGYPGGGAAMGQGRQSAECATVAAICWESEKTVIRYGSVCSGIEAATVAWHGLGWDAAWYSEIEPFPSAVLAHHYPTVPNYGDMTKFEEWLDEPINLLVGGTPCQSFSVAGLRKGLADPRGNLMLTYGAIARRYRPEWLVWENVPGVLSSNAGRDFGTFLGMLAELGYGFAYRVLDAQYFGVAQRRRRVFVVGHLGSWQRAAAVLFESHSLQGHPAPSRKTGEVTPTLTRTGTGVRGPGHNEDGWYVAKTYTTSSLAEYREGIGTLRANGGDLGGGSETLVANTLTAGIGQRYDGESDTFAIQATVIGRDEHSGPNGLGADATGAMFTLTKTDVHAVAQPVPYDFFQITAPVNRQSRQPGDPCHTLARDNAAHATIMQSVAFAQNQVGEVRVNDVTNTLNTNSNASGRNTPMVQAAMQVRRLTPVECERLQGFPDNYTNIPWRKKGESPDGPRYKALGNSMAVPVMRWIGERIQQVEEL